MQISWPLFPFFSCVPAPPCTPGPVEEERGRKREEEEEEEEEEEGGGGGGGEGGCRMGRAEGRERETGREGERGCSLGNSMMIRFEFFTR